jgi:hypothetical protein
VFFFFFFLMEKHIYGYIIRCGRGFKKGSCKTRNRKEANENYKGEEMWE